MHDAPRIDRAATAAAYLEAHADWPGWVAAEADFTVLAPDLVLSNISAPLPGARRAGIPALALVFAELGRPVSPISTLPTRGGADSSPVA